VNVLECIPELACPTCGGELKQNTSLECLECHNVFEIISDIPQMLTGDMKVFAEEIAVEDRVAIEYEQKRYETPYSKRYHDWWTDLMLERIPLDGRILDNGCGTGLLFERIPARQLVALDISSAMLSYASRRGEQLILGNSQQLPLKDSSFDAIFCRSLLHHLPEPEIAIKEMHRVLRPGGRVVAVDTNTSILSALPRMIANRGEHFSEDHKNLSRKVLEKLFSPYFEIEKVRYFGYIAYPLLGFPDLVGLFKYVPLKSVAEPILMGIDKILAAIPLIRTQSWGILIEAVKRDQV
jgi:ubiquinone/menaquinone biosynthesis C-methylase UbiE